MGAFGRASSRLTPQYCRDADVVMGTESNTATGAIWTRPPEFTARQVNRKPGPNTLRLTWVQQPTLPAWETDPFGTLVPNGWYSEGGAQDFGFCAAISDLQLAENLFMSIPALTQSFIS